MLSTLMKTHQQIRSVESCCAAADWLAKMADMKWLLQTRNAMTVCMLDFYRAPLGIIYGLHLAVPHMEIQDC